jgi:hypothetical protein
MMNNAKADGIIKSHALGDARLPTVPKKTTRPVIWTPEELAVLTGPALDQYEAEQAAWNRKVGNVAGTRSKRAPSLLPLRGLVLVAYFTRVVNMMGDTNVETVSRHYLNIQYAPDDEIIANWDLPKSAPSTVAQLARFTSDVAN